MSEEQKNLTDITSTSKEETTILEKSFKEKQAIKHPEEEIKKTYIADVKDKPNIVLRAFVIFIILLFGFGAFSIYNITNAKEDACILYSMDLSKDGDYCMIGDKAVPVLFECNGIFNIKCEVKFIMTNSVGVN